MGTREPRFARLPSISKPFQLAGVCLYGHAPPRPAQLQSLRGRSHWCLRQEAETVTWSPLALPLQTGWAPDGACLLPFADEALRLKRHCPKSQADCGRAGTRSRNPRSCDLCTRRAVIPRLPLRSVSLRGDWRGGGNGGLLPAWKAGHSAASPGLSLEPAQC